MNKICFYLTLTLIAIAGILRFYKLDFQSLWLDELYTYAFTNPDKSLSHIFSSYIFADTHPPLYYLFLRTWEQLAGNGEIALRLPSAIIGFLSIIVSWKLFPEKENITSKVIFSGLIACSYACFYFSQEARMYSFNLFFGVCTLFPAMSIIADLRDGKPLKKSSVILFFTCGMLACFTHYFGDLLFAALTLTLLGFSFSSVSKYKTQYIRTIFLFSFLIGMGVIAWVYVYYQHGIPQASHWYFNDHPSTFLGFILDFSLSATHIYSFIFISLICIWGLVNLGYNPFKYTSLSVPFLILILVLGMGLLLSIRLNFMVSRYYIVVIPAFFMIISLLMGSAIKKTRQLQWAVPVLLLLMINENILPSFRDPYQKGRIKFACNYISSKLKPGDTVLFSATKFDWDMSEVYNYYFSRGEKKIRMVALSERTKNNVKSHYAGMIWLPHRNMDEMTFVKSRVNLGGYKLISFSNNYVLVKSL